MNVEIIVQISDTAAFLLVTPEIAGEERLIKIRKTITSAKRIFVNADTSWRTYGYLAGSLMLMYLAIVLISIWIADLYLNSYKELFEFFVAIIGLFALANADNIVKGLESVAVRGRLLGVGFTLFFASRMLAIWAAAHHS
jgi:hypothetical protein